MVQTLISAFSCRVPLPRHSRCAPGAFCSRRALPGKRPRARRLAVRAMFIWSDDGIFGKDEEEKARARDDDELDAHDLEDVRELSGEAYEHPVFGKSWAYAKKRNNEAAEPSMSKGARRILNEIAKMSPSPEHIDVLRSQTSDDAADAFRRIVMGVFGSIPGDSFEVLINTDKHGLTRLLQSALATGYALRNAEWRMTLSESVTPPAHARASLSDTSGVVEWWDSTSDERKQLSVEEYVRKLEAENELLRERLQATKLHGAESNRIIDYMRTLSPEKIGALQQDMSDDAMQAFKAIIRKELGQVDPRHVQVQYSTSRDYIGQVSFWCLLVGYQVRNREKVEEMNRVLDGVEPVVGAAVAEDP